MSGVGSGSAVPPPGDHGGDGAALAAALGIDPAGILDLSASMNPVAHDPVPIVDRYVHRIRHYPDRRDATRSLASTVGVPEEGLLLTNGGAEAISLVAHHLGGRVVEPEFGLHPRGTGPLWRSNPHNPTGRLAGPSELADVWDEAFYPLAAGRWTRADPGAVVVGSLTKLFACPGLRLGYVLGDPELVAACAAGQPEWAVNALAVAALPDLLQTADLPAWSKAVAALRDQLVHELGRCGLRVRPSDANWVLVEHGALRDPLARRGIVVRDCSSFGWPEVTRIAVPTEEGLERLVTVLETLDLAGDDSTPVEPAGTHDRSGAPR